MSTPCGHKKNTETVAQYRKRCGGRPLGMIMKMSEGDDKVELIKLYNKALKMIPGSANQKKIKKQISVLRKKLKMKNEQHTCHDCGQPIDINEAGFKFVIRNKKKVKKLICPPGTKSKGRKKCVRMTSKERVKREKGLKITRRKAKTKFEDLNAVAATSGPGLLGGLLVGVVAAKTLSSALNIPFIAVNHLEGHALSPKLNSKINYPYLLLLISGGHTQFLNVKGLGNYKRLGTTIDDALGEAFDKTAKLIGIEFPGGPKIEEYAKLGDKNKFNLPKPIINKGGCNLSFAGLKTAVLKISKKIKTKKEKYDLAASFQKTVEEILLKKTKIAFNEFKKNNKSKKNIFVIAGGVAANVYPQVLSADGTTIDWKDLMGQTTVNTGTAVEIGYIFGNWCNMASANAATAYTFTNNASGAAIVGGYGRVLINTASQPTVTGATLIKGDTWLLNTNMYMTIQYNGNVTQYWFEQIAP